MGTREKTKKDLLLEVEELRERLARSEEALRLIAAGKPTDALCKAHDELEERVKERTIDLILLNNQLKREIEERNQAEKALDQQQEILQNIVDHIPVMLCFYDPSGRFRFINREFERLTGWSLEELQKVDDAMAEFYPDPKYRKKVWDFMMRAEPVWRDFKIRVHDGSDLHSSWANVSLSDGSRIGIGIDITERRKAEEALRRSEKDLRFLSSRLLTVQENERKRIARELHDSTCQSLVAMKFIVENIMEQVAPDTEAHKSLDSLVVMAQSTIEEISTIVANLRPPILDNQGIRETLSWLCREFKTIHHGVLLREQITLDEKEMSEMQKVAIYRISQEALNNIAKHSNADLVSLCLTEKEDAIELLIEDNGIGFSPDEVLSREHLDRGIGLTSMRERTEFSGGLFNIQSAKGRGTMLRASWPRVRKTDIREETPLSRIPGVQGEIALR